MPRLKPDDIIEKVEAHYDATHPLRNRMDADHQLYKLDSYDAGDGYKSYTSNEPQTYADKVISWLTGSEIVVRIPPNGNPRNNREINNDKERFIIGALRSADERLTSRLVPSIKDQLSWYIALRGWYAGRAMLSKQKDDTTTIDVTPWDPIHTYWGVGPDGLVWACYKIKKTRGEIEAQYGIRLGDARADDDGIAVYDYYDTEYNTVVVPGRFVKKRTPHGGETVPVFIGPVGSTPLVQSLELSSIEDTLEDFGESVFKSTRSLYENHNFMMSVMLELTARSRKQGLKVVSRDGTKTLDEDPYQEGTEISLGQGEDVKPLGLLEMAKESGAFMGLVSGELQRGSVPHSVYGELPFQLSGYAINTLRQGVETVLIPRVQAMEKAYTQIANLLCDQYQTGSFKAVELSGEDNNRMYFSEEITPERIEAGGDPEIKISPKLPEDDMSRYGMAQIAREGQTPLLPDLWIRDNILGIQDADQVDDAVKEQIAERTLPEASVWSLYQAAMKQGRQDLAQMYFGELSAMLFAKAKQMSDTFGGGGPGMPPGSPSPGPGGVPAGVAPPGPPPPEAPPMPSPEVLPPAAAGVPPPVPTPQGGPVVPPGQPRPGAQGEGERLRRMGLVGPGG
jgi:hypothetical protein